MKADRLLNELRNIGIETIAGVPDSTLKQFCNELLKCHEGMSHYVTANEGAAVGIAIGSYIATGKPACVYMQNSGIGNIVNPLVSLANREVYGVPMLFIVGWRGEPGTKDEPQHVFQGKITCKLFETLAVPYGIVDKNTSEEEMLLILKQANEVFEKKGQFAIIVRKGTFEETEPYIWKNGNTLVREKVLGSILKVLPENVSIISTTGKISRELYEQSNQIYGHHDNIFMTVGGMGHASMIALGIAKKCQDKKVVCIDGDGAALMHMGAFAFIASQEPENFYHIVINNQAHESVGSMPTGCQKTDFAQIAQAAGYVYTKKLNTIEDVMKIGDVVQNEKGPVLLEIEVSLESRADLGRPKETAHENMKYFMEHLFD